uniref:Uncharacterized protein n=1 Tax=Arundo donax TaxID=35708 RepID=A0A0A9DB87_ARUDO
MMADPIPITPSKLKFRRVEMSQRIKDVVDELKPLCTKVSTILNLDLLDSNLIIAQAGLLTKQGNPVPFLPKNVVKARPLTTSEILEPKFYGREEDTNKIIYDITEGDYCGNDLTVLPIVGLGGMGKTTLAQHIFIKKLKTTSR